MNNPSHSRTHNHFSKVAVDEALPRYLSDSGLIEEATRYGGTAHLFDSDILDNSMLEIESEVNTHIHGRDVLRIVGVVDPEELSQDDISSWSSTLARRDRTPGIEYFSQIEAYSELLQSGAAIVVASEDPRYTISRVIEERRRVTEARRRTDEMKLLLEREQATTQLREQATQEYMRLQEQDAIRDYKEDKLTSSLLRNRGKGNGRVRMTSAGLPGLGKK